MARICDHCVVRAFPFLERLSLGGFCRRNLANVPSGVGTATIPSWLEKRRTHGIEAPFSSLPRNRGCPAGMSLLPASALFVIKQASAFIRSFADRFQHKPSWFKLPRIFFHALLG